MWCDERLGNGRGEEREDGKGRECAPLGGRGYAFALDEPSGGAWHERTLTQRRRRILDAIIEIVCEQSFAGASVAAVCRRAKVSGRVFYDTFEGLESCFLAALDDGYSRVSMVIGAALEEADSWLEGVRGALAGLLTLFDEEPTFARFCIVESLTAGPWALERREQCVAGVTEMILGHPDTLFPDEPHQFASEGVMASLLVVIQNQLLANRSELLIGLLEPLTRLAVTPYLDAAAAAEQVERSKALLEQTLSRREDTSELPGNREARGNREVTVPDLLLDPRAHRARECVLYLSEHPGASNRQIARGVGIAGDTQISTILSRLRKAGVLSKDSAKPGGPNAWKLTAHGLLVARRLLGHDRAGGGGDVKDRNTQTFTPSS